MSRLLIVLLLAALLPCSPLPTFLTTSLSMRGIYDAQGNNNTTTYRRSDKLFVFQRRSYANKLDYCIGRKGKCSREASGSMTLPISRYREIRGYPECQLNQSR
jgi:hypothetical protein